MPTALFQARTQPLVDAAIAILSRERPMTLRQLLYRLVVTGKLPSTADKNYHKIARVTARLREASDVPRTWMVDTLRTTLKPSSWSGLTDFGETMRRMYRKDLWARQNDYVEVFVEKDAIASTVYAVTYKFDVPLRICRGYASISFAGEIADQWRKIKKPIHAYYIGDFDPSGFDIERDLREKLSRYSGGRVFTWTRLAVVADDFDRFDLLPLAVKPSDARSRKFIEQHGERCAEVDAIPPTELRRRIEAAINQHIDQTEWTKLKHLESLERDQLEKLQI